ncbi:MAG: NAD(P)/FAD-dependent oxidoreductase [Ilumatobacteraceae bacterium]
MRANDEFTIAVIGAGSVTGTFVGEMTSTDHSIVVFEPELVGGECPFLACMPSKSLLHDRTIGRSWAEAVERRDEIVSHLDDTSHADQLRRDGATIVRERATIAADGSVEAGGVTYTVDHIVVATGSAPVVPDVEGLDRSDPRVWLSREALTGTDRPESMVVLGGGAIGIELAFAYAGFGTVVTVVDQAPQLVPDVHTRIGAIVEAVLTDAGVTLMNGVEAERIELGEDDVTVHLDDGRTVRAERILVAAGRVPNVSDIGLDALGVDPDDLDIDDTGRLNGVGADVAVWVAGDAAGRGQYTHIANHHGVVVADQISGDGERMYGDAVTPACIFITPPVMIVGPPRSDLAHDDDVVWADVEVETPRHHADEQCPGFLSVAARRSTGCIVAAHGIGAGMDELSHAFVIAIDGEVPVTRLVRTIQPFPTFGGVLSQVFEELAEALSD